MNTTRQIRRAEPADADSIVDLVGRIQGQQRDPAHWRWKYCLNPAGRSVSVVMEEEGHIVGHIGGILTRFSAGGAVRIGAQELDIFIDEDYRKGRTFFRMLSYRKRIHNDEPIDFSYGFANDVTSRVSERSPSEYRYGKVASLPRLVKLLDARPYVKKKLPVPFAARALGAVANGGLRLLDRSRVATPTGTRLRSLSRFDERFDAFWDRIQTDYPIMIVRNQAYLNWRYVDIPDANYEIVCLEREQSDEVLGFAVLGMRHKGVARGTVLDLVTPRQEDPAVTRSLLSQGVQWFRSQGMAMAVCWMYPHCHVFPHLVDLGFRVRASQGNNLMYRGLTEVMQRTGADHEESWFISMGDSDL